MASLRVFLVLCAVFFVSCVGAEVRYPPEPFSPLESNDVEDVSVFYEALAPYGAWFEHPEYGQVWAPRNVPQDWRPYTHGRWVYTDYGWTWASAWEWGWAPFHYGRWTHMPTYGWVWVPGTVWAPAWVAWRHSPGWVGWAPLPPQITFSYGGGLARVETLPPSWFAFVEEYRITQPHIHTYIAPPARNVTLVYSTQNVTNYVVVERRVVSRSIPVERIERVTARPIPRIRVVTRTVDHDLRPPVVRDRERELIIYRPRSRAVAYPGTAPQAPTAPPLARPERRHPEYPRDAVTTDSQLPQVPPSLHTFPPRGAPEPPAERERWRERYETRDQDERDDAKARRRAVPGPVQVQPVPSTTPESPELRPRRRLPETVRESAEPPARARRPLDPPSGPPQTVSPPLTPPQPGQQGLHAPEHTRPRLAPRQPQALSESLPGQPPQAAPQRQRSSQSFQYQPSQPAHSQSQGTPPPRQQRRHAPSNMLPPDGQPLQQH